MNHPQTLALGMLMGMLVMALLWWSMSRRPKSADDLAADQREAAQREALAAEALAETYALHAADQRATAKMLRKRAARLGRDDIDSLE